MKKNFDNALLRLNKIMESKIFLAFSIFAIMAFGMFYYYGLIGATMPSSEECIGLYNRLLSETYGTSIRLKVDLVSNIFNLVYKILGFSVRAVKINWTIRYGIILFFTVLVSLFFSKGNKKTIWYMPVLILLLVELKQMSWDSAYGFFEGPDLNIMSFYPPNFHLDPIFGGLICLLYLGFAYKFKEKKAIKNIFVCLFIIEIVRQVIIMDTIFIIMFIIPFVIIYGLNFFNYRETNKLPWIIIAVITILVTISKFIPIQKIQSILWSEEFANQYSTAIYGNTSWTSFDSVTKLIDSYLLMISDFFNIGRPAKTVISFYSICTIVRIICLIMLFVIVIKIVKESFLKALYSEKYDIIDYISAYSFLTFSIVKIVTMYSIVSVDRYFFGMVPMACILLVRNIDSIVDPILKAFSDKVYVRNIYAFVIGLCIVLISTQSVYSCELIDTDSEDIYECINYFNENGEGYVVAPVHVYARMAIQDAANPRYFTSKKNLERYGIEENARYVISNFEDDIYPYKHHSIESEAQLFDEYGVAVEKVKFGRIVVYRMW